MKINKTRSLALATLSVMTATAFGGATLTPAAHADSKTWKKVAIGAAAVTAYGLIKHDGKAQTLGAIATAGSYVKYRSDKKKENNKVTERRRIQYYKNRYGSKWRSHYKRGK